MSRLERFLTARDFLLTHREDYQTAYKGFQWPVMDQFNWAIDYFEYLADTVGDQPCLRIVDESGDQTQVTFQEMARRSDQVANFLHSLGIRKGDRLLLMLGNEVPLWEVMLACTKLGAVIIPTSTLMTSDELRDRIDRGRVRAVVTNASLTDKFDEAVAAAGADLQKIVIDGATDGWHSYEESLQAERAFQPSERTAADDLLLLYFTSGTTAKAKLVSHTHQSYPVGHLSTMYWLGLRPGDVHLNISSPGWAKHAWSNVFAPWNAGATAFVYTYQRFDADRALRTLAEHAVTTLCAPPTVWRLFIQTDLTSYPVKFRELISAGEPLNPEVIEQVRNAWGLTIRDGYGQTETTAQIGNSPGQPLKLGSMGRPMPGYEIALLNPQGQETEDGQIAIRLDPRPVGLMKGYADDEAKTAEIMADGYYRTGDVASRDEDGYLTYVGRADDVFKASDYRISPFELESVLIEHPAVAEAAVIPSPDPLKLAVPKAFIVLTSEYEATADTAASIYKHSRQHLAPFKRIRRLEFATLPKTISGKIRRVALKEGEAALRAAKPDARSDLEFWEADFEF
ncbi:MAG: AMP-binding protein [Myxococcota bacterium]